MRFYRAQQNSIYERMYKLNHLTQISTYKSYLYRITDRWCYIEFVHVPKLLFVISFKVLYTLNHLSLKNVKELVFCSWINMMGILITIFNCPHISLMHFVVGILFSPEANCSSKLPKLIWRRHKKTKLQKICACTIVDKCTPVERDIKVPRQFLRDEWICKFSRLGQAPTIII